MKTMVRARESPSPNGLDASRGSKLDHVIYCSRKGPRQRMSLHLLRSHGMPFAFQPALVVRP